jgi:hypothetical protein
MPLKNGSKDMCVVVFVVTDKVVLGQVFSEYFGFISPANLHSTNFSTITITYHLGMVQ